MFGWILFWCLQNNEIVTLGDVITFCVAAWQQHDLRNSNLWPTQRPSSQFVEADNCTLIVLKMELHSSTVQEDGAVTAVLWQFVQRRQYTNNRRSEQVFRYRYDRTAQCFEPSCALLCLWSLCGIVYAEDTFIRIQVVANRDWIRQRVCDRGRNVRHVVGINCSVLYTVLLHFATNSDSPNVLQGRVLPSFAPLLVSDVCIRYRLVLMRAIVSAVSASWPWSYKERVQHISIQCYPIWERVFPFRKLPDLLPFILLRATCE
jgi:hypothetical protein